MTREVLKEQSEALKQQAATSVRAAEINAQGSLLLAYAELIASGEHGFVAENSPTSLAEFSAVRDRLNALLSGDS